MKQIFLSLFILAGAMSANAQFTNSKWAGTLQMDQAVDVVLNFKTDTMEAISSNDGHVIETMLFTTKDKMLTLKKVYGDSNCGSDVVGKYKYDIKDDMVVLELVDDACSDRSNVLNKSSWKKQK